MNRFSASELAVAISSLHGLACRCAKEELKRGKGAEADETLVAQIRRVLENVGHLANEAKFEGAGRVARANRRYLADATDCSSLKLMLISVVNEILADADKQSFLRVAPDRAKYIDHEPFFDISQPPDQRSVYEAFPSARSDAKDAGNCLAAECNTAAVFHMMRAVEWGLRALCVHLGYRRLRTRNPKTGRIKYQPIDYAEWDRILREVKSRAQEKLNRLTRGAKKQAWQEFYLPALQDVEAFKDVFRNHVMHTRREYTRSEAEAIRDRVQRFMRLLASRISEV